MEPILANIENLNSLSSLAVLALAIIAFIFFLKKGGRITFVNGKEGKDIKKTVEEIKDNHLHQLLEAINKGNDSLERIERILQDQNRDIIWIKGRINNR